MNQMPDASHKKQDKTDSGVEIRYSKSKNGQDTNFELCNTFCFLPPAAQYLRRLTGDESLHIEDIWLLCLLHRHGMLRSPRPETVMNWVIDEEINYYDLDCCGTHVVLIAATDLGMEYTSVHFFVEDAAKREAVAQTISGIIEQEGRTVTYGEWTELCDGARPPKE